MSLINEALRRTRDAAYQNAARPSDPSAATYRLEPESGKSSGPSRIRLILLCAVSVLALGGLLYGTYQFAYVFPRARMEYMPATMTPPPTGIEAVPEHIRAAAAPVTVPAPVAEPVVVAKPVEPALPAAPTPSLPAVVSPPPPPPPPVTPAELPKLLIQGFSTVGSVREVMINGRTLRIGDTILGARIITIEKPVVRVVFDGREFELALP